VTVIYELVAPANINFLPESGRFLLTKWRVSMSKGHPGRKLGFAQQIACDKLITRFVNFFELNYLSESGIVE